MLMLVSQEQHFDQLFRSNQDPWGYESVWSEKRRHSLILAMLDLPVYSRAFEPGCANGVFTWLLAARADEVVSWDGSSEAVRLAREKSKDLANVSIQHRCVPDDWPSGKFDLVVLSDFLYYLSEEDIVIVANKAVESMSGGGFLVACNWIEVAHDFLTPGGAAVHEILQEVLGSVNGPAYLDSEQIITGWRVNAAR
jgi:SAM-dependent methyltransferase